MIYNLRLRSLTVLNMNTYHIPHGDRKDHVMSDTPSQNIY